MKQFAREDRVHSLLLAVVTEFIRNEANTDPLITVTRITTSPDYKKATVYFTTIPDGRDEDALIFLKRHGGALRAFVKKKSNLKTLPFFEFAIDAGERHRQHIDEVVRDIGDKK